MAHLLNVATTLATCLTVATAVAYSDKIHTYTACLGREETFLYDLDNLVFDDVTAWRRVHSRYINQPFLHPFKQVVFLVYFSYILVVPAAYMAIYYFRRKNDSTVPGRAMDVYIQIQNTPKCTKKDLKVPNVPKIGKRPK